MPDDHELMAKALAGLPVSAPQPVAKGWLDYLTDFASGGLHGALKGTPQALPEWTDKPAAFFQDPDFNAALGMAGSPNWTKQQLDLVRKGFEGGRPVTMPVIEGRSPRAVQMQASRMGLLNEPKVAWTPKELEDLRRHLKRGESLDAFPGRTKEAVRNQAIRQEWPMHVGEIAGKRGWADQDMSRALLELDKQGLSAREIANELGATRNAVIGKLQRLRGSTFHRNTKPTTETPAVAPGPRQQPSLPILQFMKRPLLPE